MFPVAGHYDGLSLFVTTANPEYVRSSSRSSAPSTSKIIMAETINFIFIYFEVLLEQVT